MKPKLFPYLWSILPSELVRLQSTYAGYLQKEVVPGAALFDIDLDKVSASFRVVGSTGILPVEGVIMPKADIFTQLFGGATLDVLTRDFKALVQDDSIETIILDIDSPGGVVTGVQEFADLVFQAGQVKDVIAISSSIMTSAAMWIGAAATKTFITSDTVMSGSIGVVVSHVDFSELEKMLGIKTTEITAGKFKRIFSNVEPLSEEGRAELQSQVDHIMDVFVGDIAKFRNATVDVVKEDMADGKLFIGDKAVNAGLVDGIITFDDLIDRINAGDSEPVSNDKNLQGRLSMGLFTKGVTATVEMLKAEYPDIFSAVLEQGKATGAELSEEKRLEAFDRGFSDGDAMGQKEGATDERRRILEVQAQSMPGHEGIIKAMIEDGESTAGEAAIAIVKADKDKRGAGYKALEDGAPKPVKNSEEILAEEATKKEKEEDPLLYAWDKGPESEALQKEFGVNGYTSYNGYFTNDERYKATGAVSLAK